MTAIRERLRPCPIRNTESAGRPGGKRATGARDSARLVLSLVLADPPSADTRMMADPAVASRITPCAFQDPPRGVLDKSTTVCSGPPAAGIRRRRVCVKNRQRSTVGRPERKRRALCAGEGCGHEAVNGSHPQKGLAAGVGSHEGERRAVGRAIVPLFVPSGAPIGAAHDALSGGGT